MLFPGDRIERIPAPIAVKSVSNTSHSRLPSRAFNGKLSAVSPGQQETLSNCVSSDSGSTRVREHTGCGMVRLISLAILALVRRCLSDQRTWIQPIVSRAWNYLLDLRLKALCRTDSPDDPIELHESTRTLINMFSKNSYFDRSVLLMLIALEALLFYTFYYREIAWYPPQYFDQTAFLTESYRLQERIHEDGLGTLWMAMTRQGAPNGWLLHIEGALSGLFFGGGRLPQLLINFLAFATLQMVAFVTARAVWISRIYGYMVLGLILCLSTAWIPQGGLFDFRADLMAYCLYGIWACAILRSKLFLDRRRAIGCSLSVHSSWQIDF